MDFEEEVSFLCPHCGENISMLFESLYGEQSYIEDCQVCCKPIKIHYLTQDEQILLQSVEPG